MLAMHDPEILSIPEDDENNENISTRDTLKAPNAEQFKEAIHKEVRDLTKSTGTLTCTSLHRRSSGDKEILADWYNSQVQVQEER
jgi:hypothetical protein